MYDCVLFRNSKRDFLKIVILPSEYFMIVFFSSFCKVHVVEKFKLHMLSIQFEV